MIVEIVVLLLIVVSLAYISIGVNKSKQTTNRACEAIIESNNMLNTIKKDKDLHCSKCEELESIIKESISDKDEVKRTLNKISNGVLSMTPSYTVNMNKIKEIPCVKLKFINKEGKRVYSWFLLDTGSKTNVIDSEFIKQIQYEKSDEQTNIISSTNDQNTLDSIISVFSVGGCPLLYKTQLYVNDLSNPKEYFASNYNINFGGIIGTEFMLEHGWQVDVLKRKLRIYSI